MTCPWPHPPHTPTESGDASVKKCYSEALLGSWGGSYRSVEADPKGKCGSGGCPVFVGPILEVPRVVYSDGNSDVLGHL